MALFRIALGVLVFALACQLSPDYSAFFLPELHPPLIWTSLHFLLPLFSVLLIVGFFSRISALICWAGLIVVQQANSHILYGADLLLHLLLFWAAFLPISAAWSMDGWLFKKPSTGLSLTDRWAAWAITGQICIVYWSSVVSKIDPVWIQNHNALFFAFSVDDVTSPAGTALLQHPGLLRFLTIATLSLEFLGPLLLFIPFYTSRFRFTAVILFFIFHLIGMQYLMRLGFFPWVCAAAWSIFIPGFFWDFVTGRTGVSLPKFSLKGWPLLLDRCATCLVIVSFADALAWNLAAYHDLRFPKSSTVDWMKAHDPTRSVLHLNQRWQMYAPFPQTDHGWLVIPTELADGTQVDLFTARAVSWSRPEDIGEYLGTDRWRCYLADLMTSRDPEQLRHYSDYLVSQWKAEHPDNLKVKKITIIFMRQMTLPNLTISAPEKVILLEKNY